MQGAFAPLSGVGEKNAIASKNGVSRTGPCGSRFTATNCFGVTFFGKARLCPIAWGSPKPVAPKASIFVL